MKAIWAGVISLALSTAVYASMADSIVGMPKFNTLAVMYQLSSPQALINGTEPAARTAFADYVRLHQTRLETSPK